MDNRMIKEVLWLIARIMMVMLTIAGCGLSIKELINADIHTLLIIAGCALTMAITAGILTLIANTFFKNTNS